MPIARRRSDFARIIELPSLLMVAALSAGGCSNDSTAPSAGPGVWTLVAPMPTARTVAGAGVIGGTLYIVGGFSYAGVFPVTVDALEAYDPAQDRWTTRAPMPTPHGYLATGVANGILYAIGGEFDPAGTAVILSTVEAYDPVTDHWTTKAPMPTARRGAAIGVVGGIVYVVGGELTPAGGQLMTAAVEAYDPTTDSWSARAPMPTPRDALCVVVINDVLYAIGGYDGNVLLGTVEAYDPSTNSWTTKAPMPTARAIASAAAIDGKLYVAGGYTGISTRIVEAYDPSTDRWARKSPMSGSRAGLVGGVVNGILYAVGGEVENGIAPPSILNRAEKFTP